VNDRVAIATCRGDFGDPDQDLLTDALASEGIDAIPSAWDDPQVAWEQFDLTVIRSTWDYTDRVDEFVSWARRVPKLVNSSDVVEFSTDKHYLAALAARGVTVVPTQFCDVGVPAAFPNGDFVVKPTVGAGSMDAARYGRDDLAAARQHVAALHARGRDVMIQPYVHSVDSQGELALVFIDGTFSHAMRKGAMLNVEPDERDWLFRVEQMSRASADAELIAIGAQAIAASAFEDLCYARVDLVNVAGRLALMELELVEPSLFLSYHPPTARELALAIRRRCDQHRSR
jgi:glutathione synthase/RimK-type ligase-like ATP-grasp enzyme